MPKLTYTTSVVGAILVPLVMGVAPAQARLLLDGNKRSAIHIETARLVLVHHVRLTVSSTVNCGLTPYIRIKINHGNTAVVRLRARGVTRCEPGEVATATKVVPQGVSRVIEAGTGRILTERVLTSRTADRTHSNEHG